jgi:CIC family chloride channel protein
MELAMKGELLTHDKDKAVLTLMNIRNLVETNFIKLQMDMTLGDVIHKGVTKSSRNLYPVLDDKGRFTGIILLDDIRPIMFDRDLYDKVTVQELMQRAPEIIDIRKDGMQDIMRKFQESDAWNLPVIENDKYIGFVSKSKLLTAYRQKLIEVTV